MQVIENLIATMITSIIDDVEHFKIQKIDDDTSGFFYEVSVSKDDVGKLIGRKGRIARSIRTVAQAAGAKQGVRVVVRVMDTPLSE
jgi:hypothetical protein